MSHSRSLADVGGKFLLSIGVALTLAACGGGGGDSSSSGITVAKPFNGITKIVIDPALSEAVTFGGTTFGAVGAYQKIRGTAFGQLDPNDPQNTVITDMSLAEKDAATGGVKYSMDFYILKPVDLAKGNHKIFYEANNRGGKQFGGFNQSSGGNNPTTAAHAGQGFLMNQGYTLVWSGWDGEVATNTNADILHINLPLAKNVDGTSITGPTYEYIVFDNATTKSFETYYPTASTDTTKATLTQRHFLTDTPTPVPSTGWSWTSPNTIALANGAAFQQSWIYELTFTAKDPYVAGIGMAAIRDFVSFLRNETKAADGSANPIAGDAKRVVSWSLSQPGRLMNDYVWLGFNQDLGNRKVFDGVFNWISAGNGLGINYRFAQNGRTQRNRQNHLNAESVFPFSYTTTTDTFTGKTDGRNARCTATKTCPLIMNIVSGNEYWVKAGSTLTTNAITGKDVVEPANVRNYYVAGSQHGGASAPNTTVGATSFGSCAQFGSGVEPNPLLRALWVDLDQWVDGTAPPPSAVPSLDAGTGVLAKTGPFSPIGIGVVPQADLGWPTIPNVTYSGLVTVHNVWNFGPIFSVGVLNPYPGLPTGNYYTNIVPKVDVDGNDIPGIRLPEVVAPQATNSGWGLRSAAFGGKADGTDGCESGGQSVVFAPTKAARDAIGDPRLSLDERYGNHAGLVAARTTAANALLAKRLLLQADVNAYISAAALPISIVSSPTYGSYTW
jgi:hypothetical protein